MLPFLKRICYLFFILASITFSYSIFAEKTMNVPVLCYHNIAMTPGSMNMTPERFEAELKWLKDNGFTVVPLKEVVKYLQGTRDTLPTKSIVITVDDGWQSAYTYIFPLVKKYKIPVTLFIYPETISQGKHAMTWEELKEMQATGLFDIQGHTYSHPNFKQAKRRLSPANYEKLVTKELVNSKKILEEKMGKEITLLAWPFGIYDSYLEQQAKNAGYVMAFSIDARVANKNNRATAQPRFMILQSQPMKTFEGIAKLTNT